MTCLVNKPEVLDARFVPASTMFISGPSGVGKSRFILNLITNSRRLFQILTDYIAIFIGSVDETLFKIKNQFPDITTIVSDPDELQNIYNYISKDKTKHGLLIIDDYMTEISNSKAISKIYSVDAHHRNVSIIVTTQNLYSNGKERINILRNSKYICIFPNPMDKTAINLLISRMSSNARHRIKLLNLVDYVLTKYDYILISGHVHSPKELLFRSDIFGSYQRVFRVL
jgi:hypothetical protein